MITLGSKECYSGAPESKPEIQEALGRFANFLTSRGAEIFYAIPVSLDGRKVGLDDYFVLGGTPSGLIQTATRSIARTPKETPTTGDSPSWALTDLGNAERMVHCYGKDLKYVATWQKWLFWGGTKWVIDETGGAIRIIEG